MGDGSSIEWLRSRSGRKGATWQPVIGCSRVDERCDNCYAMSTVHRGMSPQHKGLTKLRGKDASRPGPDWNGTVRLQPEKLSEPLRWTLSRRIFVCSLADLFHEKVPFEYIAAVFGVMAACPKHTFLVLTKRPKRARAFFAWLQGHRDETTYDVIVPQAASHVGGDLWDRTLARTGLDAALSECEPWPLPNVQLGVSVSDQRTAEMDIPELLECPAAVHWVSYEPALGPVDFQPWLPERAELGFVGPELRAKGYDEGPILLHRGNKLQWIVIGGESGGRARPFELQWARDVIEAADGLADVFVKQLGSKPRDRLHEIKLADSKGGDMQEWHRVGLRELCVREFPESPSRSEVR